MWKIVLAFVAFAALALFILSRGGDIEMGGEKHGSANDPHPSTPATGALVALAPAASVTQ